MITNFHIYRFYIWLSVSQGFLWE